MIEILGVQQGQEHEAALHLRRLILNRWPDLARSKLDVVKMFVGLKLYGHRVEDLDLVVIGSFTTRRSFDVEFPSCPRDDEPFVPKHASVKNFALVVEVNSHDATGVRFENKVALVRYIGHGQSTWECVTEKNRTQMFEFKKYLYARCHALTVAQSRDVMEVMLSGCCISQFQASQQASTIAS